MVSREQLMGNWNGVVRSIKEKFGDFNKEELARVEGNFDQLVSLVQKKSGQTKEQVSEWISEACETAGTTYNQVANRTAQYVDAAGEVIRENYDRVATEARKGVDYTSHSVSRRPLESMAIAIGAGLIAGVVLGVSMASRKR